MKNRPKPPIIYDNNIMIIGMISILYSSREKKLLLFSLLTNTTKRTLVIDNIYEVDCTISFFKSWVCFRLCSSLEGRQCDLIIRG